MPELPERPSLEFLRKLAKDRLEEIRRDDPNAKLTTAQLAIAQYYDFKNWRALKAEVEKHETKKRAWTPLHTAARDGNLDEVRRLLAAGADPNFREAGDNTTPLHWAAASRQTEIVRALLDAGADVHGVGDVHELDAIGWATFFHDPKGGEPGDQPETAALLVERGAKHHIFSALAIGTPELIRQVVRENPRALERRMSQFENRQTALQFAKKLELNYGRQGLVDLLIELGALRPKATIDAVRFDERIAWLRSSVQKVLPMIFVPDVAETLDWYTSIGFKELARYEDEGLVNFGVVSLGGAEILINMHGKKGRQTATLWFYTNKVDDLYRLFVDRGLEIEEEINDTFYRARQFAIQDPNGYVLYFIQNL